MFFCRKGPAVLNIEMAASAASLLVSIEDYDRAEAQGSAALAVPGLHAGRVRARRLSHPRADRGRARALFRPQCRGRGRRAVGIGRAVDEGERVALHIGRC